MKPIAQCLALVQGSYNWLPSHPNTKKVITTAPPTSGNRDLLLQDTDVELERELGRWAEEGLDDWGPAEGRPVCAQLPFSLPHLLLNLLWVPILGHLPLLCDADIGLFNSFSTEVNIKGFHTPTSKQVDRATGKMKEWKVSPLSGILSNHILSPKPFFHRAKPVGFLLLVNLEYDRFYVFKHELHVTREHEPGSALCAACSTQTWKEV